MKRVIIAKPSEILKGRRLPDGTIRDWGGRKYKKVSGKWVHYSEGKRKAASSGKLSSKGKIPAKEEASFKFKSESEYRKDGELMISFEPTYDEGAQREWGENGENAEAATVMTAEWDPEDKEWIVSSGALDTSETAKTMKEAAKMAKETLEGDEIVQSMKLKDITGDYNEEDLGSNYWGTQY